MPKPAPMSVSVPMPMPVTVFAVHLFTDIEGSTRLWEQQPERMRPALARHDVLAQAAVHAHGGRVVKTTGDGLHAVFDHASDALGASLQLQHALQAVVEPMADDALALAVRCGIHAGADEARGQDFYGRHVNRAARIMSAAHGGQVLLSDAVAQVLKPFLRADVQLRDLGAVRLRDLPQPEHLFQVVSTGLRADFPALQSLAETPHNLPQPLNRFIGRDGALADLGALLRAHRLVTLWGPGGMGKSRLSIELAHGLLHEFPDGIWLVELAPLSDATAVPQAVAAVLGVQESRASQEGLGIALAAHVQRRRMLLILDNCEHVHAAAAALAKTLLQAGAGLRVLASSRELLHVAGEQAHAVAALSVPQAMLGQQAAPNARELMRHEAVRLLVDRAAQVRPGFEVNARNAEAVAEICRRLDGIPLAIELAAARLRMMAPEVLARRLVDSFALVATPDETVAPRQRTLQVLIDWSWKLLGPAEQRLLARLSVFAGGCTLDAAEAVCADDDLPAAAVLDGLAQLVDKSLLVLQADGQRYRLLETVRAYAAAKLVDAALPALQARHARWFTDWAEQVHAAHDGDDRPAAGLLFDIERANLLSAHAHALAGASMAGKGTAVSGTAAMAADAVAVAASLAFRQAVALRDYWLRRGLFSSALQMLQRTLALPASDATDPRRARALFDLGHFCLRLGRHAEARDALQQSLAIVRARGESMREPAILQPLGLAHVGLGDSDQALACFRSAITLARAHGRDDQHTSALVCLAQWHQAQGQWHEAERLYREALALAQGQADAAAQAMVLVNLGMVALRQGRWGDAAGCAAQALDAGDLAGSALHRLGLLDLASGLAAEQGDWIQARAWHAAAQGLCQQTGLNREQADEAFLAPWRARLDEPVDLPAAATPVFETMALASDAAAAECLTVLAQWLRRAQAPAPDNAFSRTTAAPLTTRSR